MFFSKKNLLVSFSLLVVAGGFSLYLGLSKPVEATEDEEGWVTVAEALATQSDPVPPSVSHVSHVRPATHQTTHVAPTHASSRTQVGGVRQASAASKLIAAPAEEEVSRELPRIETVEEYVNDSRPAAPMGLPNAAGQIWREYDIRPYTTSQRLVAAPEERVRDWILRETGETTWHGADLAILSVTPHKVRVYHTPQMQSRISQVIDRLVAKDRGVDFICRVVTVSNPRWRAVARPQMRVLPTQPNSPICVWSLPRKNYGQFILGLEKFAGYREFVSPNQKFSSGEKVTFALATTREYVKDVRPMRDFIAEVPASVEDGLTLSLEPLLTKDGK